MSALAAYAMPDTNKRRCQGYDATGNRCEVYTPHPFALEWASIGLGTRQCVTVWLCGFHAPMVLDARAEAP